MSDAAEPDPDEGSEQVELKTRLAAALDVLNSREKLVITRRYGLDAEEPDTLEAVGKMLKVTRERVRQIETKAINKLRQITTANTLFAFVPDTDVQEFLAKR